MFEEIIEKVLKNEFFSGGFVLMITGAIMVYLRRIPLIIIDYLKQKIIYDVVIDSKDDAFDWLIFWFNKTMSKNNKKKLIAFTMLLEQTALQSDSQLNQYKKQLFPEVYYKPNSCGFFMRFAEAFFWVYVNREKLNPDSYGNVRFHEELRIVTISKNGKDKLQELILQAYHLTEKYKNPSTISVYSGRGNGWYNIGDVRKRQLNSVHYSGTIKEDIIADIKEFFLKENWYIDRGIPHRRGYLLYGPPGNGKTSLILTIASELNFEIYTINLSSGIIGDAYFYELISSMPLNSILVLEDIDGAISSEKKSERTKWIMFS